jgi:hypothetical protein
MERADRPSSGELGALEPTPLRSMAPEKPAEDQ